ncbi:Rieske 2Fe-2S domain-containing protein [Nocardia sp. R6R-6]|uniref:Rieske 2Fe-2S domain-containing protein n=1 Tax=Nocardia sp. R6R-6 TaxID=3459303 RepID=UPI00403DBBFE
MTRIKLCNRADVPTNGIIRIADVPGIDIPLAVADSDGRIFCIADLCSHQTASLSDGWVEDGCVECPLHESRFDLATGAPDVPPAREPIATFPVAVENGEVFLLERQP